MARKRAFLPPGAAFPGGGGHAPPSSAEVNFGGASPHAAAPLSLFLVFRRPSKPFVALGGWCETEGWCETPPSKAAERAAAPLP
jgi:hypothetical protein